jgi:hypothetical protein
MAESAGTGSDTLMDDLASPLLLEAGFCDMVPTFFRESKKGIVEMCERLSCSLAGSCPASG